MKRKIALCIIIILIFAPLLVFILPKNDLQKEETDNLILYNAGLIEINESYSDQYDSRIIVKSEMKLNDEKAVFKTSGFNGLNVIQYESSEDAQSALEYYQSLDYVEYACIDSAVEVSSLANNQINILNYNSEYLSWGADLLGVAEYQNFLINKYGRNNLPTVYVAVLDSGIDTDNEFLKSRIAYEYGVSYYKTEANSPYAFEDDDRHGTHVSGTIVDLTLENVKIIPIKVLNSEGSGSTSNIISGIEYVIKLKNEEKLNIAAANFSLGSTNVNTRKELAFSKLYDNNIMPVVAAGNENFFVDEFTTTNIEKALLISALQQNESNINKNPYIASYSNYGKYIDLCLPGSKVLSCVPKESNEYCKISSTYGKYAELSGTSMATPHATALVALYATYYNTDYSVEIVEKDIKENVYDFGETGIDDIYGCGVPCMSFAIKNNKLASKPSLSFGELEKINNFDEPFTLKITDNNSIVGTNKHKIYYSTDGSLPTLVFHQEYNGFIEIDCSTFLRFVIYEFDTAGNTIARSDIYEVTYIKGEGSVNDDGTGFEITKGGIVTHYNSGLKEIVLPEYINGIKVKSLDSALFVGKNITSFVCEQNILIGYYPFSNCDQLKYIKLNSTDANYIAKACFLLEELNLPNITHLKGSFSNILSYGILNASDTFKYCFNLKKIYAPKVSEINDNVFSQQRRLEDLTLDWANIKYLGEGAFEYCKNLNIDFNFPSTITKIPAHCFSHSNIKSITANNVTAIDNFAFYDCTKLSTIKFGKLTKIGEYAFKNSKISDGIILGNNAIIEERAFDNCKNLTKIDLTNCIEIGEYAFYKCKLLKSVNLSSCNKIFDSAFEFCDSLESVKISEKLTEIPESCFSYCKNLKQIDLSNVKYIYDSAFEYCKSLTNISLLSLLEFKTNHEETYYSHGRQFYSCENLNTIVLGDQLINIPKGCFMFCSALKSINTNNIKILGERAFLSCRKLNELNLSNAEILDKNAFAGMNSKLKIILGQNEKLISKNSESALNIERAYISKNYKGPIGSYIKNNFNYCYDDVDEDYKIYTKEPNYVLTIKFADGTIIEKTRYSASDDISLPSSYEKNGKIYNITSWVEESTNNKFYSFYSLKKDTVIIANDYNNAYKVNFYYDIDFDKSGTINDEGDLFSSQIYSEGKECVVKQIPENYLTDEKEYIFLGWMCNDKIYLSETAITVNENMDFHAIVFAKKRKYTVNWYDLDGDLLYTENVAYGKTKKFSMLKLICSDFFSGKIDLERIFEYFEIKDLKFITDVVTEDINYFATSNK